MICLICGIPGAGKSWFSARLTERLTQLHYRASTFSFDDFEIDRSQWNESTFKSSRERAITALTEILSNDRDGIVNPLSDSATPPENVKRNILVVDDIFYLKSMRKEIYVLCKRWNLLLSVFWLNTPLAVALGRNQARQPNHRVDESTVLTMSQRFEPPDPKIMHDRYNLVLDPRTRFVAYLHSIDSWFMVSPNQ
jgi:tRNA uridine 5-carbamoylmethylation protein Kti12